MRTNLELDADLLGEVRTMAGERGVTLGRVVSDLLRQALRSPGPIEFRGRMLMFRVPSDAPVFGDESVRRALDD